MPKPITETLDTHVKDAVAKFEDVVKHHVANNPKLAMEDKIASLAENSGAFKGHAHQIQAQDTHVATHAQTAAVVHHAPSHDAGKGTGR